MGGLGSISSEWCTCTYFSLVLFVVLVGLNDLQILDMLRGLIFSHPLFMGTFSLVMCFVSSHHVYSYNIENGKWDDSACYIDKDIKYSVDDDGQQRNLQGEEDDRDKNNNEQQQQNGKSRCAKMDCHLENTHFSVLGEFF